MEPEKNLIVSGLMFLVAMKSFEILSVVLPASLKTCSIGPRFAGSLISSTLAAAFALSIGLSIWYFKKFGDKLVEKHRD